MAKSLRSETRRLPELCRNCKKLDINGGPCSGYKFYVASCEEHEKIRGVK